MLLSIFFCKIAQVVKAKLHQPEAISVCGLKLLVQKAACTNSLRLMQAACYRKRLMQAACCRKRLMQAACCS